MILDGNDLEIGKVEINESEAEINGVTVSTNSISVYSKDEKYRFYFWTLQEYEKFNELELNKKTDILDLIDDYDIDFSGEDCFSINSRRNTEVYFTRIGKNKYILNAEIKDFSNYIFGDMKDYKNLKVEAIIDFNEVKSNENK